MNTEIYHKTEEAIADLAKDLHRKSMEPISAAEKFKYAYETSLSKAVNEKPITFIAMDAMRDYVLPQYLEKLINDLDSDHDGHVYWLLFILHEKPNATARSIHTLLTDDTSPFQNNEDEFWEMYQALSLLDIIEVNEHNLLSLTALGDDMCRYHFNESEEKE